MSLRASLRVPARATRHGVGVHVQRLLAARYASTSHPPPESHSHPHKPLPEAELFNKTSRPGLYHTRPSPRDLPPLTSKWPAILAFGLAGVGLWTAFMVFVANQEKLSSSVMQQLMTTARESTALRAILGEAIRPEPVWWMNGDPWINGAIHIPGGNIDLSFRVKGHKGAGTLYFTSIRRAKGEPFQILRFKVIADDGTEININPSKPS